mgnify:FL=1
MKKEVITLNRDRNVTLTCYLWDGDEEYQTIPKRPAVVVLPGGGYDMCSNREADPIAMPFFQAGYHAFILRYSLGKNKIWPKPLEDYEDAMQMIRSHTDEWKVYPDKIAVMGFSAGGHLAGAAAALPKNRPNAAVLGYPVLRREDTDLWNPSAPDIISHVNQDTCPCFLFHTRNDSLVPVGNTIAFMNALDQAGVTFETHVYSFGPHGFSTGTQMLQGPTPGTLTPRADNWVADAIGFLEELFGTFGYGTMNNPVLEKFAFPEKAGLFSADCSVQYLLGNPRAKELIAPVLRKLGYTEPFEPDALPRVLLQVSLRTALTYTDISDETAKEIDTALRALHL